eukprot:3469695-Rhodomonas_salina.1
MREGRERRERGERGEREERRGRTGMRASTMSGMLVKVFSTMSAFTWYKYTHASVQIYPHLVQIYPYLSTNIPAHQYEPAHRATRSTPAHSDRTRSGCRSAAWIATAPPGTGIESSSIRQYEMWYGIDSSSIGQYQTCRTSSTHHYQTSRTTRCFSTGDLVQIGR